MQIKKVILDGKEVEVEFNERAQLSDSELDRVQGGLLTPWTTDETILYQYVCKICGWKSDQCTSKARSLLVPHIMETTHQEFRCEESS